MVCIERRDLCVTPQQMPRHSLRAERRDHIAGSVMSLTLIAAKSAAATDSGSEL